MFLIAPDVFSLLSREELGDSSKFAVFFLVISVGGLALLLWRKTMREEETRDGAMVRAAANLGLAYQLGQNTMIPNRYHHVQRLSQGRNRYASNVMTGSYKGHRGSDA